MTDNATLSKKQFDEWASSYDSGIWSKYFQRSTRFILDYIRRIDGNGTLVDVGSGTGSLCISAILEGIVSNSIGIDLSTEMVSQATKKIPPQLVKQVRFLEGQSERLPLADDSANFLTCLNSFHHYDNQSSAVREAYRVLRTGGFYIILDPVSDGILRWFWCKALKFLFKEPYAKYLTTKAREELVTTLGFKVLEQRKFMYFTSCSVYQKC